jgi:hypothetical protein
MADHPAEIQIDRDQQTLVTVSEAKAGTETLIKFCSQHKLLDAVKMLQNLLDDF